jgi:hypothetical protein
MTPAAPTGTTHATLAAALAAFQAALPNVAKDNTAQVRSEKGSYSYKYADLSDISPIVLPLLGRHGLAFVSAPTLNDNGQFVLAYQLVHESGDKIEGSYPLPSAQTPAQQLGSAITYARRYALCAVTGVAPGGDDDDANSAPPATTVRAQQDAAAEAPEGPTYAPPPQGWRGIVAETQDLEALKAVYDRANNERWATPAVIDAINARKAALTGGN